MIGLFARRGLTCLGGEGAKLAKSTLIRELGRSSDRGENESVCAILAINLRASSEGQLRCGSLKVA